MTAAYFIMAGIFLIAFVFETLATSLLVLKENVLHMEGNRRTAFIAAMWFLSTMNAVGGVRMHNNYVNDALDVGNVIQALFALSTLIVTAMLWDYYRVNKSR